MKKSNKFVFKKNFFVTSGKKIEESYEFDKEVLGLGSFGKVVMAKNKDSGVKRAIKVIPKTNIENKNKILSEIKILKTLDHPNIVKLYETFEDDQNFYMVFEICKGGELFDTIIERGHFSEEEAKELFRHMVKALHHCHQNGICHRDLKPENFLFTEKNDLSAIKMIDFGLSIFFKNQNNSSKKENN